MAEGGLAYPQVFVVDRPLSGPPLVPVPRPRRTALLLHTLILLVSLALCGLAVEAYFISRLYHLPAGVPLSKPENQLADQKSPVLGRKPSEDEKERSNKTLKPEKIKASAHLTDLVFPVEPDGVLQWRVHGAAFSEGLDYKDGSLQVKKEGLYFIYSKVLFVELTCSMFKHTVMMHTFRYPKDMELMKAKRFSCSSSKQLEDGALNSYLGGVFHLRANEAVYVKVLNHSLVRLHDTADNFFGMFMI